MKNQVELLAPAGSIEKLKYAFAYGADAAYVGLPLFSLRARENEFGLGALKEATEITRRLNKKIYFTVNIFSRNRKIHPFEKALDDLISLKPDALIMSDPGLMISVREKYPETPIHLSVQANCMNWKSVQFWHKSLGIERVILSRELALSEIKEIKQRVPDVELEAFVHGAICIAYSGRCLLSAYMSHRDANQGVCDNSCRESFNVYLEDRRNPGELYPAEEDSEGTLIMNAKDLCLIEHLQEIIEAGVCSLKIEGRSKSEYYVSLVSLAYRLALNDIYQGRNDPKKYLHLLEMVSNRGYHKGFMIPQKPEQMQNYDLSNSRYSTHQFAGLFIDQESPYNEHYPLEVRNQIQRGDLVTVTSPDKPLIKTQLSSILDKSGQAIDKAHGGAGLCYLKLDQKPPKNSILSLCKDA